MEIETALIGLVGAVIGAASSAVVTYIAQRQETKRRLQAELVKAGFEQWKHYLESFRKGEGSTPLYPPETYILALARISSALERFSTLPPAEIDEEVRLLMEQVKAINNAFEKYQLPPLGVETSDSGVTTDDTAGTKI